MGQHILRPNGAPTQPLVVAQPVNDIQLVALVAAHLSAPTPADRVAEAICIVAEAVVQVNERALTKAIESRQG